MLHQNNTYHTSWYVHEHLRTVAANLMEAESSAAVQAHPADQRRLVRAQGSYPALEASWAAIYRDLAV